MADNLCRLYQISRIFFEPSEFFTLTRVFGVKFVGNDSESLASCSKAKRLRQISEETIQIRWKRSEFNWKGGERVGDFSCGRDDLLAAIN